MGFSQVRCFPETGRMHQIRVHLAESGFPIAGDKLYSGDGSEYLEWMEQGWNAGLAEKLILPRHALHASRLGIDWQGGGINWVAELAPDLRDFIDGKPVDFAEGVVNWCRKG
jgi:23S rRNA pseudouridine1911/1915/1917 synthase